MLSKRQRSYDKENLPPSGRLRANLAELYSRNELPAARVLELAQDVNRVAPTELTELQNKGRLTTEKNAARLLRNKLLKKSCWMPDYHAEIRTWCQKTTRTIKEKVPMQLIHEVVAVLLKFGDRGKLLSNENMDPLTKAHLEVCQAEAGCPLLGIGIWGDGAPTQWDRSESIDVISMSLPGSKEFRNLRVPLLALPHSRVCPETWQDVFAIIKWSLIVLATGHWPQERHDGSPWEKSDNCRRKARPILQAALVEVRQDWKFAAEVFGFPAHNTGTGCCWACTCTPAQVEAPLFNSICSLRLSSDVKPQGNQHVSNMYTQSHVQRTCIRGLLLSA